MPSTRRSDDELMRPGDFGDSADDPDYRESSADESDDDEMPPSYGRDRAQWTVDNYEEIAEVYRAFLAHGRQLFGNAFFQLGDVTGFSHYLYNMTTPGAIKN